MFSELPSKADLTTIDTTPMTILDRRMMRRGNDPMVQLHVQWDKPAVTTTWEDSEVLRQRFPAAPNWNHEDPSEDARSEDGECHTSYARPSV